MQISAGLRRALLAALLGLGVSQGAAAYENAPAVQTFIAEMVLEENFDAETLRQAFAGASRQQAILDAIARPAEKAKPWKEYRPIFLTEQRIREGVAFAQQNAAALARAEREYGVPAEVITAIIGVETFYGRNTGKWRVLDALSTLAFDYPPRAPFFRQQLREFLLMCREEQIEPLSLTGSYAGAMGLPQFMPSSFRNWAVDFDGDGHINIWTNPTDAIGSVASYFRAHGWKQGGPVVSRAQVRGSQYASVLTSKLEHNSTVGQLRQSGWTPDTRLPDSLPVTAFRLEGAEGDEFWMGLPNFYAITRYNHSAMYAMAVHQLSQSLLASRPDR